MGQKDRVLSASRLENERPTLVGHFLFGNVQDLSKTRAGSKADIAYHPL